MACHDVPPTPGGRQLTQADLDLRWQARTSEIEALATQLFKMLYERKLLSRVARSFRDPARIGDDADGAPVTVAIKVARHIDEEHVATAARIANLLGETNLGPVVACVDGNTIGPSAAAMAGRVGVASLVRPSV